jgi:hypothetical protein
LSEANANRSQTNKATDCNRDTEPNKATEPTKFGEPNTDWDKYKQNRRIDINKDSDCQQDREDLPTIEDQ